MKQLFKITVTRCHGKRISEYASGSKPDAKSDAPTSAARMLALAHYFSQLIENDTLRGYSRAAVLMGVSRSRLSQIMNLLHLSPHIQESILSGNLKINEHQLRAVLRLIDWRQQKKHLGKCLNF
ncbi:MAG: hypothetical protein ABIK28_25120 [Planctomycetota bacterium]